jgi:hypothetical protein
MNRLFVILLLALSIFFLSFHNGNNFKQNHSINSILGDISFISKYGHQPDASTDQNLRIKTHLEYVENLLRGKNNPEMNTAQLVNRNHLLDLLHNYWTEGIFPRNYDYADRSIPCFIDKNGNICAVGYLIEQTSGRAVAEKINSKHKYEKIFEMDDDFVDDWISASGLTKEECAMIQPSYYDTSNEDIPPVVGVSSVLLGLANIPLSIIDGKQISRGAKNDDVAIISIVTGALQTTIGIIEMPQKYSYEGPNETLKSICIVDISLGTVAMIMGTWNLLNKKRPEDKSVSWNIFSYPTEDKKAGIGFSLVKRF